MVLDNNGAKLDSRLSGELFYGKERIRWNKKLKAFTFCHGGVVGVGLGLGCSTLSLREIDSWLGHEQFWVGSRGEKGLGRIEK